MKEHINIPKLVAYVRKCHMGQFRWDGVTPYVSHPVAVAAKFTDLHYQATALLHDVIEDCGRCAQDLRNITMPEDVIEAVRLLTRTKEMNYWDYIISLLDNEMARKVKIADIEHNMETVKGEVKRKKYNIALFILKECPRL